MKYSDLIAKIAKTTGHTQQDTKYVVAAIFNELKQAMSVNDSIQIPGFGTFNAKLRPARNGRNPATGETISIPEAKVPSFKPTKSLKDSLNP